MPAANLPKLLSYDKLIEFIKSKDIKVEFYADLESFLKELTNMYIKIDLLLGEKSSFMHFLKVSCSTTE